MWQAEIQWKKFNDSLTEKDLRCINCKYRFNDGICVDDGSPVGYGGSVSDDFGCGNWEPELFFFDARLKEMDSSI